MQILQSRLDPPQVNSSNLEKVTVEAAKKLPLDIWRTLQLWRLSMCFPQKPTDTMNGEAIGSVKTLPGYIVFVLGAPGAGKGTLCKRLLEDKTFNDSTHGRPIFHWSVGDLLRKLKADGSLSEPISAKVDAQELLDGPTLADLFVSADLQMHLANASVVVIDGFPRDLDQKDAFEGRFRAPDVVLMFDCKREVALERYLGRKDATRPPGDVELFERRCNEFETENVPIMKAYGDDSLVRVDVSGDSVEANYSTLKKALMEHRNSPWFTPSTNQL